MIKFKPLIVATIVSMGLVTSASAQCPQWARDNPPAFQAQYPNRDILNECTLTPAGRIGLELPGGAAPVFGRAGLYGGGDYDGSYLDAREWRGMRLHHVGRQRGR